MHRSQKVSQWLGRHAKRIRLFRLPGYSPDLNPDELLNNDVKANAVGRRRPGSRDELVAGVRSYLRSTQKCPGIVQNFFKHPSVAYAAQ